MRLRRLAVALVAAGTMASGLAATAGPGPAHAQASTTAADCPWAGPDGASAHAPVATRVSELMSRMTLADKLSMVDGTSGPDVGNVAAIPSLCVPELTLEDGPAGVGDGMNGVTQLPAPVADAATWDPSDAQRYGKVIGAEDKGKGVDVDLGPTVNIVRDPRWGRAFEALGEDPYLTGQLGASEIGGIQSQGVMSQVKHLAVYNQETNRNTPADDAIVSERTMQEIYLPAFQDAVNAGVSSVMCSYSTINGQYACQNPYIENQVLRKQFGFQGFVTSDWGATHSTVPSARAGLDMDMPGDFYYGAALQAAVTNGQVPVSTLNTMVSDILAQMFRFGLFDKASTGSPGATVTTPAHQATAKDIAEQGTVLLKNDGNVLPLSTTADKSVAVIGADASSGAQTAGGGSAGVNSSGTVTPLQGITRRTASDGVTVNYAEGPSPDGSLPTVPASAFTGALNTQFYNNMALSGTPVATTTEPNVDFNWNGGSPYAGVNADQWSAKFTGTIDPATTGTYTFSLTSDDGSRLYVNGQEVIDNWRDQAANTETGTVTLTAGQPASIEVDYYQDGGSSSVSLGWQEPGQDPTSQAVAAAKSSDVAVVFASDFESEGSDLSGIDLPASENNLIKAVAAANPNTIVVLNTGSAVTMPWLDQVKGVLEAWYPGQEDGDAIASVLYGDVNPSGHLPVTFPKSLADVPASTAAQWPGVNGQVQYSEGVDVGYRWYQAKGIAPLFPFGYGLSYTRFKYSDLVVSGADTTSNGQVTVSADVTNTGQRAGADVAQLYVGDPASAGEPPEQLKGFDKVSLNPGQTKRVTFTLPAGKYLSHWDATAHNWAVADGTYKIGVGDSSGNLPLQGAVHVTRSYGPQGVTVTAPSTATTGAAQSVTAAFSNADSDVAADNASLTLHAPDGWTVTPSSVRLGTVAAHATAKATFRVTATSAASGGSATLTGDAAYSIEGAGAGPGHASGTASVNVPYQSMKAAYDTIGISDNSNPGAGNFDGGGYSYSAQSLASVGITPGAAISSGGYTFTWPDVATDYPDDVTTNGQIIDLSGTGSTLAFLGAGTNGSQSGKVTVTYTDGTTSTATLNFDDWYTNAATVGDTLVATSPNWNVPAGSTLGNHAVSVYQDSIPLTAGKTVASVTLPDDSHLHLFAAAFGS